MVENSSENLYQILECSPASSTEHIKTAYRKLALKHHPDKGGDKETFQKLSRAYQILSDPDLRQVYDQSRPLPDIEFVSPLKVFADCFSQWLRQYPLIELMFKDSCFDILRLMSDHQTNPVIQTLMASVTGSGDPLDPIKLSGQLLETTQCFTAEWFQQLCHPKPIRSNTVMLTKKVYVTLDDIYVGKRYPHHFQLTNEDLQLSNNYQIMNPDINLKIPLEHSQIDLDTDLLIIDHSGEIHTTLPPGKQTVSVQPENPTCYTQKVTIQLDVLTLPRPNMCRIDEYDLLIQVDVTITELTTVKYMTIPYLNHKHLRFRNPLNCNLRQLYVIDKIAFPNREVKQRGRVYLQFNLILGSDQKSMLLPDDEQSYLYHPIPCDPWLIYRTEDRTDPTDLPQILPETVRRPV